MENVIRHGDVLLKRVDSVPEGIKSKHSTYVVAEGEVTGHVHELCPVVGTVGELPVQPYIEVTITTEMVRYLALSDTYQLKHQEHGCLSIEPGTYEIIEEQEYDYFENETKKVLD